MASLEVRKRVTMHDLCVIKRHLINMRNGEFEDRFERNFILTACINYIDDIFKVNNVFNKEKEN